MSYDPIILGLTFVLRPSWKKLDMPLSLMSVRPSLDNLSTAPLALSVKYVLNPKLAKDSGFLDIPYSPTKGTV